MSHFRIILGKIKPTKYPLWYASSFVQISYLVLMKSSNSAKKGKRGSALYIIFVFPYGPCRWGPHHLICSVLSTSHPHLLFTLLYYSIKLFALVYHSIRLFTLVYYSIKLFTLAYYSIKLFAIVYYSIKLFTIAYYSIKLFTLVYYSIKLFTLAYYSITIFILVYYSIKLFTLVYYRIKLFILVYYSIKLFTLVTRFNNQSQVFQQFQQNYALFY